VQQITHTEEIICSNVPSHNL